MILGGLRCAMCFRRNRDSVANGLTLAALRADEERLGGVHHRAFFMMRKYNEANRVMKASWDHGLAILCENST